MGHANREQHPVGFAMRDEVDNLISYVEDRKQRSSLSEFINEPSHYDSYAYYGNYSATHSAYIARASDILPRQDDPYEYPEDFDGTPEKLFFYRGPHSPLDKTGEHYFVYPGHHGNRSPLTHKEETKGTLLHWAAVAGSINVMKYLLSIAGAHLAYGVSPFPPMLGTIAD